KNPNNPTLLTYYQEYKPSDILVTENNIAYLADGYFGIRVLDVSDIYHIQQLGYYKISGYVSTLRVRGNYILAALDHGGFYVFEYYGVPIKEDTINIKSLKSDNFKVDIKRKKLFLAIRLSKEENLQLDIINNLGRIITTTELGKMKEGMNYIYLELPHIPSGIYFIRLKKENEIIFRKFFFIRN
ncbi:MAG: T9SS type A sorting domain-containing protein, partial [candidate division WOR-3 bacterium]